LDTPVQRDKKRNYLWTVFGVHLTLQLFHIFIQTISDQFLVEQFVFWWTEKAKYQYHTKHRQIAKNFD